MKKIAIFATYLGKINRGAETFVIELSKELKKNYDVTIYSSSIVEELNDTIKIVEYKIPNWIGIYRKIYCKFRLVNFIIDKFYYLIPDVIEQFYFNKALKKKYKNELKKYDLIFPNNGIWGVKLAEKLRKYYKIPFIYTGHGGIGKGEELILKKKPDFYIALTEDNKVWAKKYSKNVRKIGNGIDLKKFENSNKISNINKTVICVAAFTAFKRQKLLIDAVSKLKNVNLILLGKGELEKELDKYGKEKLGKNFLITSVPYEKVMDFYEKADLFSLPSINEPFGIVYLEAMAMNLPIISPDDNNRREIIGEAGLYCNVESSLDYAETINNAFKKKWDNIPRKRAELFSWIEIAKRYSELIEKILGDIE